MTAGYSEELYSDTRYQVLQSPAAQPGNVVGYDWNAHSYCRHSGSYQDEVPVRHARSGVAAEEPYAASWRNHEPVSPQQTGTTARYGNSRH